MAGSGAGFVPSRRRSPPILAWQTRLIVSTANNAFVRFHGGRAVVVKIALPCFVGQAECCLHEPRKTVTAPTCRSPSSPPRWRPRQFSRPDLTHQGGIDRSNHADRAKCEPPARQRRVATGLGQGALAAWAETVSPGASRSAPARRSPAPSDAPRQWATNIDQWCSGPVQRHQRCWSAIPVGGGTLAAYAGTPHMNWS